MLAQVAPDDPLFFDIVLFLAPILGSIVGFFALSNWHSIKQMEQEHRDLTERLHASRRVLETSQLHRELASLMPGEPTMCLLDHIHSQPCDLCNRLALKHKRPLPRGYKYPLGDFHVTEHVDDVLLNPYVPFDPDLAEIEVIIPEFTEDELKWKKVPQ